MENQGQLNVRQTLSTLLRSNRRHVRYVQILACLALVVAVAVPLSMRQHGVAMSTTETRLSCHYSGSGAHTHNADCYDADGNLVCPLEERELHVHDDSCYTEHRDLICGMQEGEGAHTHSDTCYNEDGKLTCGLEESEGHVHTDECYETTRELTCSLEEVTEEHVHGPACFETVQVPTPAQELTGTLKVKDENGNEYVTLVAQVKAAEGVLPKGATMTVQHVNLDETDPQTALTVRERFEAALLAEAGDTAAFAQIDAVGIKFHDAQGNLVDPDGKVEVRISTATVRTFSDQRTAGDEAANDSELLVLSAPDAQHGDAAGAEVVRGVALVNQDESDASTGHEDTVLFEAAGPSVYAVARVDYVAAEAQPAITEAEVQSTNVEAQPTVAEAETQPSEPAQDAVAEVQPSDPEPATAQDATPEPAAETDPTHPAQSFTHRFTSSTGKALLRVDVAAPEGAFPAGTTMKVTWMDTSDVEGAVTEAVAERTDGKLLGLCAVDISFIDPEGNEIEPAKKITVTFASDFIDTADDSYVVHVDDEGKGEVIDSLGAKELESREMADEADELVFESDAFSTYVVAVTTLRKELAASDGKTYEVTVDAPAEAGIPQDAELRVSEIMPGTAGYEDYLDQALQALGEGATADNTALARFFDIKIMSGGQEVQPQAPVAVSVQLADAEAKGATASAVHFGSATEAAPEVLDVTQEGDVATFDATGFSVYGVIYTVDFHWDVDGKAYDYSIQGGDAQSLRELLVALKVVEATEAEAFVAQVADVKFSDPELVAVAQVEKDTTAGELKEKLGVTTQYSAQLKADERAEMDAKELKAGDWALVSLKAFDTTETLTITLDNGDVLTIKVTDAQLTTHVIAADGKDYTITVTYGPEAGIPDGTELKVTEYTSDDLLFNDFLAGREEWLENNASNILDKSDDSNKEDVATDATNSPSFEPGFGDTIDYEVDGKPTEEDKVQALSQIQALGAPEISGYLLFDISLVYNGKEIEPKAPVQVTIQSTSPELQEYDDISVGHYTESEKNASTEHTMETIDEVTYTSDDSGEAAQLTVDFEATSFSLYDVAGIQWTANQSKTVYFALKTGINKVLDVDQNGAIPVMYSDIEGMDPSAVSTYIQSLSDYTTAEPIIIYDKSGSNFYAIDGNGNLAQVYESGDMVLWNGQPSIGWKLVRYMNDAGEYTGYYDFINMETGKFLAPQVSQTVSDTRIGVQLDGAAGHNSTIKAWDSAANKYCGLSIDNGQLVTTDSIDWFFASVSQTISDDLQLQTVETVDSAALGVTIKMFNYPNTCSGNNRGQYQTNFKIFNSQGKDWLSGGPVIQGLVNNTLNSAGYPVATYANTNLDGLFSAANGVTVTNANHLFIQQTYDETGYFEYSSFENYAHLESNGDFTVYRQVGSEDIAHTPGEKTYGNSTDYFFNRGNFLPYNSIANYRTATQKYGSNGVTNKYDEDGNRLSGDDPRNGEALFLTQETVDYFFGMSMEANFYQPVDGKNNGEDVVFEFNGDDDLWVFIDNVLVLDIGGCHNAHSGSINYSTGEVWVETGNGHVYTTIKQCFENAHIFPDGTPWNPNRVSQYFKGDTLADYSQHTMKLFYMERGAGASNLHVKFNLPVIKDAGKLIVDKVVSGTVNQKYSNDKFPFQVVKVNGSTETTFATAVYESTGEPVEYQHQVEIDGETYTDVFYLRPGEAAVFDVPDNSQQYYVKELGIDISYYDKVLINREEATITDGIAESSVASVKNRNRVTYDNHGITEDLRITKVVEGDVKSVTDMFEFYVYLTGQNNQLVPYSNGDYYVLDPEGNYCTYVDGLPVGDPSITEETRTAYHSGQWGTIGSIPDGYTVLIPDLLVGTDFMVSERMDNIPEGYELKSIAVDEGTADAANLAGYTNVTVNGNAITIGAYSYTNHCEGKLKMDASTDAMVTVTNQAESTLTVNKVWTSNSYVTAHGPVQFALYKLEGGNEVLVEDSVKTLTAPATTIEYKIVGDVDDYVVREVVVTTSGSETTVTPVANNGVIEVSGETTTLGTNMTDSYVVTYAQGDGTGSSRTDTVTNAMPQLTVNKKDMTNGSQLPGAVFKLTGSDGETALTGYESITSDSKTSGNLLDGIYLSNGTYYLVETKAPAGFNALTYKVKIVVSGNTKIITAATEPESMTAIADETPDNNMLYTFSVYNNPGVELPHTGGVGTYLHTLCGLVLFVAAGFVGIISRRRESREAA